ncbi:MAG TPA: hypothetical protein VKF16_03135 [Candidatus Dormibacteraeota bacterium]|nr:hypothetical protein [Candidatus Dormibacteraeota bacterium]
MGEVSRRAKVAPVLALFAIVTGCSVGAPSTFTLTSASVDESYVCPTSASELAYTIHATIDVRNGTSSSVTIRSVAVVMTLAAVKGGWLEHVGDKYAAAGVSVSPETVSAGSSASLNLSIPSTCTNGKIPSSGSSYGEYSVAFTVVTSSGTHTISSQNRHRIVAA